MIRSCHGRIPSRSVAVGQTRPDAEFCFVQVGLIAVCAHKQSPFPTKRLLMDASTASDQATFAEDVVWAALYLPPNAVQVLCWPQSPHKEFRLTNNSVELLLLQKDRPSFRMAASEVPRVLSSREYHKAGAFEGGPSCGMPDRSLKALPFGLPKA